MNKKWTLHIEDFAKVKSADIEISPLMCFVGDNNTGKSYIMGLLWGLLTYGKDLFPARAPESKAYNECEFWLAHSELHIKEDAVMGQAEYDLFIRWFNQLLSQKGKELVKKIFNNKSVEIGKLEISSYKRQEPLVVKWSETAERFATAKNTITFPSKQISSEDGIYTKCCYVCWNLLMNDIAAPLYTPTIRGRRNGGPVYLPASRTGFMLTYDSLIDASLKNGFSGDEEASNGAGKLTAPYVDFLQLILKFDSNEKPIKKYENSIAHIENNMIGGGISTRKDFIPTFQFAPKGIKKELPLYLSSSVVAEISPILLLIKSGIKFNSIIIEEPEAHLHPRLQVEMARLIIKLMNAGVPIWITTHSDTILQHINNMIKLNTHLQKDALMDEHKYEKDDLVDVKDIRMYQFGAKETKKTEIIPLKANKYGFVVPTFNEALDELLEEVYAFQEEE